MNPYARALLSAGLAVGLVLLAPSCFDFDQDYEDCLEAGLCIPNDAGVPDAGTPDSGACSDRLCLVSTHFTPGSTALFAVWGSAPDAVRFAGQFEQFAFWNGSRFTSGHEGPYDSYMYKLWGTSASDVWAVGNDGTILHFNGTLWEDHNPDVVLGLLTGAWSPAPGEVIIAGPKLYHWDAGTTAGAELTSDSSTYSGVWGVESGRAWAVGSDERSVGTISERSLDGGWSTPVVYPDAGHLNAIHGTGADNVWVVGTRNTLLHRTSAGWERVFLPLSGATVFNLQNVWVAPEGEVYITTESPTVIRRELDGGWSFFTPKGAEGIELDAVYGFPNRELWFVGGYYNANNDEYDGGFAFRYLRQ